MPRKKSANGNAPGRDVAQGRLWAEPDAAWGGFLNLRLTDTEKSAFYQHCDNSPNWHWVELDEILSEGAKLSVAYDRVNESYVASLTGRLAQCCPERMCATARAGTLDEAVALIVYKHVILADGDWSAYRPRTQTLYQWG